MKKFKKVISSFKNTSILILDQTTGKPIYNIKGENSFIDQNKKILEIVNNVSLVNILENYEIKTEKIIFSPEFLREGHALYDNLYPSRIIVGSKCDNARLFASLLKQSSHLPEVQILYTSSREAEAIKLF